MRALAVAGLAAAVAGLGAHGSRAADLPVTVPQTIEAEAFDSRWEIALGAYVWAASLTGTVGTPGLPSVDVDASFADILNNLDLALMSVAEIRYGRFGVFADIIYTRISADGTGPLGFVDISLTNELTTGTLMGSVRAVEQGNSSLDVMAGARLWHVAGDLRLRGQGGNVVQGDLEETWVDPMVGVKGRLQGESSWFATGWGAIGGFGVSSDLGWDVFGGVGYQVTDRVNLLAGYRALGVDYEDDGFVFDAVQHGPLVAGVLRF